MSGYYSITTAVPSLTWYNFAIGFRLETGYSEAYDSHLNRTLIFHLSSFNPDPVN